MAREKLHETNEEFEKVRVQNEEAKQAFERVRRSDSTFHVLFRTRFQQNRRHLQGKLFRWLSVFAINFPLVLFFSRWPRTRQPKHFWHRIIRKSPTLAESITVVWLQGNVSSQCPIFPEEKRRWLLWLCYSPFTGLHN